MKKFFILTICSLTLLFLSFTSVKTKLSATSGEYTFYCGSTSSSAQIVTCAAEYAGLYRWALGGEVKGESAVYSGENYAEILRFYHAKVLFEEDIAGVKNYYCHASGMGKGVDVDGYAVNLHVAVRQNGTVAVGSPLIFGGF